MNRASPPVTGITADFAAEHSIEPKLQLPALALAFCIEETAIELSICSYDTWGFSINRDSVMEFCEE